MIGKLKIKVKGTEQDLMENLLNLKHSGADKYFIITCIALVALEKRWHIDKLTYYSKLLGFEL